MSEKQQATNKWENYERYYHYSPLKHFQNILILLNLMFIRINLNQEIVLYGFSEIK